MQHELQQAALWRKPAASAVLNASAGGCVWKGLYGYENSRQKAAVVGAKPRSDPAATRTQDRLLRRQMLYPAELPDRPANSFGVCAAKLINFSKNLLLFLGKSYKEY